MHLLTTPFWCVRSSSSDSDSKKLECVASRGFLGTLGPSKERKEREVRGGEVRGGEVRGERREDERGEERREGSREVGEGGGIGEGDLR